MASQEYGAVLAQDENETVGTPTIRSSSFGLLSLLEVVMAGVMIGMGVSYGQDCNNGATDYLVTGGVILLCANLLPLVIHGTVYLALWDGKISKADGCGLNLLVWINNIIPVFSIGVALWVGWGFSMLTFSFTGIHCGVWSL